MFKPNPSQEYLFVKNNVIMFTYFVMLFLQISFLFSCFNQTFHNLDNSQSVFLSNGEKKYFRNCFLLK